MHAEFSIENDGVRRRGPGSLLRYPGGKSRLADSIFEHFDFEGATRFVEPCVGGGALMTRVLARTELPVLIADLDPAIARLWACVFGDGYSGLINDVWRAIPSADTWREWKRDVLDGDTSPIKTLGVCRWSPNGRGTMSGGPARDPGERWNPEALVETILTLHRLGTERVTVEHGDCMPIIENARSGDVCYLDPPYVAAGPSLYRLPFDHYDHMRLATALEASPARWYLSYDDHQMIRDLYHGHETHEVKNGKKTELLITSNRGLLSRGEGRTPSGSPMEEPDSNDTRAATIPGREAA